MKISVTLELNDENEVRGLTQFMSEVEAYRNPMKAMAAVAETAPVAQPVQQPAAEQQPEPQVVGSIAPKGPKAEDLNRAALKFAEKKGLDAALAMIRPYGVAKVSELTDPVKMQALLEQFVAGLN